MRAIVVVLLVISTPGVTRADDWYGEQTLGSDVAAYATLVTGAVTENPYVAVAGGALWLLGAPAIHLSHGHEMRAGWSLGTRIGFPLAGGLLGHLAGESCDFDEICSSDVYGVIGVFVGVLAANIVDASIAWDRDAESDATMFTIGGGF
jgi:hypothetical protein